MSPVLQRLQRRAIVVLAWVVLALSVAPAAAEPMRPLAALCAAAASSLATATGLPGQAPSSGSLAARRAASTRTEASSPHAAVAPARQAQQWIERATPASHAAELLLTARSHAAALSTPHDVCRCGAHGGRRLYLSICRLSC